MSVVSHMPDARHSWTQSDHFAIAQRFVEPETSFWYPKSWDLKPDYSPQADPNPREGITKADFPLFLWISGKLMQMTGDHSPRIPRLIWVILATLACLGAYKSLRSIGQSVLHAFVFSSILVLSPMWLFYSSSLIPSIAGFTFFSCGIWMVLSSRNLDKMSRWFGGAILLTFAMLSRPPLVLFVVPILAWDIWREIKSKELPRTKIIFLLTLALLTVSYELHIGRVASEMGSIFLLSPEYPDSLSQAFEFLSQGVDNNLWIWFNPIQLVALFVLILIAVFRKRDAQVVLPLGVGIVISLLTILYMFVMSKQFRHHDYYAIDILLPLLLVWLVIILSKSKKIFPLWTGLSGLVVLTASMILNMSFLSFERSFDSRNLTDHANWWYSELEDLLLEAQFLPSDRVAVLDAYSNNRPLAMLKKEGYTVINTSTENLTDVFDLEWDKALVPIPSWTNELLYKAPWLEDSLVPSYMGGRLMLMERYSKPFGDYSDSKSPEQVLNGFCGAWGDVQVLGDHVSDSCIGIPYNRQQAFPLTFRPEFEPVHSYARLTNEFRVRWNTLGQLKWVVTNDQGYYSEVDLTGQFPPNSVAGLTTILAKSLIPHHHYPGAEWKCYLWNIEGEGEIMDWAFSQENFLED